MSQTGIPEGEKQTVSEDILYRSNTQRSLTPPSEKWYENKYFKILYSVVAILALMTFIYNAVSWKLTIENNLQSVRKDLENFKKTYAEGKKNIIDNPGKENEYIVGYITLMQKSYPEEQKTSFGVNYKVNFKICEINEYFIAWGPIGLYPGLGHFFEIQNTENGLVTWAMVVGSFKDQNSPYQALKVSEKVAEQLQFNNYRSKISAKITLMDEKTYKSKKECVILHDDVYKIK